jgi:hypothetical protein
VEALFVRDGTIDILRVNTLVLYDKFGVFMVLAEEFHSILCDMVSRSLNDNMVLRTKSFPSDNGREIKLGITVDGCLNTTLKVHRPTLI